MATLQEFIGIRPQSYGSGNANLLYSSSVSGSDDTPIAPFHLQGFTIPFTSKEGTDIEAALKEVDSIKFTYPTGTITAEITGRQKRTEYFYFTFTTVVVNTLPSTFDVAGNTIHDNSEFTFVPYTTLDFNSSDYNPLVNNSEGSLINSSVQRVDRFADSINPTNLTAIIAGTAQAAEIQDSSYSVRGILNSKYNGAKTTIAGPLTIYNKSILTATVDSNAIQGNEPSLSFVEFQGSIHSDDADTTTIKAINNSDREIVPLYFNEILSGSHPNKIVPNFPISGSYIYQDQGNRLIRVVKSKIYSIDKGVVYTTNEFGGALNNGL